MTDLGNRLKAARAYAGEMTQEDLAARLPFSLSTYQRTEAGGREIDETNMPGFVKAIATATKLPEWFFTADWETIGPVDEAGTSGEALGRITKQLEAVRRELREQRRDAERSIEKIAKSSAYDRGRLNRIEEHLAELLKMLVDERS